MRASRATDRSPAIQALSRFCIALLLLAANAAGQTAQEVCPLAHRPGARHACQNVHWRDRWHPPPLPYLRQLGETRRPAGKCGSAPCDGPNLSSRLRRRGSVIAAPSREPVSATQLHQRSPPILWRSPSRAREFSAVTLRLAALYRQLSGSGFTGLSSHRRMQPAACP